MKGKSAKNYHAMTIEKFTEARTQYLYIRKGKIQISAARVLITSDRYSPWLVTHGREYLPENAIARGIYLTKLFNQH